MSPARSDLVNAIELAGRAAVLERSLGLEQLPRLAEAGARQGTTARAMLTFGRFEKRATVEVRVEGSIVLVCQRCLRPCDCRVAESAQLIVVADDAAEIPGGFEAALGDAERLSVTELIEEQLLLGMPLVPLHEEAAQCREASAEKAAVATHAAAKDKQRPFSNLRELLDKGEP